MVFLIQLVLGFDLIINDECLNVIIGCMKLMFFIFILPFI